MSDFNNSIPNPPEEEKQVVTPVGDIPPVTASPQYDRPSYAAEEWRSDVSGETAQAAAEPAAEAEQPTEEAPQTDWRANPYSAAEPPHAPAQPQPPQSQWYQGQNGGTTPPPPPYQNGGFVTPPQPPKKRKHTGTIIALSVIGALAVLALTVTVAFSLGRAISSEVYDEDYSAADGSDDEEDVINDDAPALSITDWSDNDGGLTASQVIEKNLDCTVVITVYQIKSGSSSMYSFGTATPTKVGSGSGIVMTADGYIITNWHVVTNTDTGKQYDEIDVTLHDGAVYKNAKVVGADESTDLAVLKVEADGLTAAEFGDSSKMTLGARVIALGNAGGLQWSATQGIISGLARDVYEDTGYSIKCLQTDAAINPGNSGGPLINNQGQVIGINSAKIASTDVEGLGFSIPINEAKTVIDDLTKYGYVKGRVQLGITGYSVNSNGYHGFAIQSINEDSVLRGTAAAVGDLITAVDGTDITGYGDMRAALAKHKVGDEVQLSILRLDTRTGERTTFTVTCQLAESKN